MNLFTLSLLCAVLHIIPHYLYPCSASHHTIAHLLTKSSPSLFRRRSHRSSAILASRACSCHGLFMHAHPDVWTDRLMRTQQSNSGEAHDGYRLPCAPFTCLSSLVTAPDMHSFSILSIGDATPRYNEDKPYEVGAITISTVHFISANY
jgi:hypothetical protein